MNKKDFTLTLEGKETEFYVLTPSSADKKEAQKIYNTAFTDALKSGAVVRARMEDLLIEQGLWDENKQARFDQLQREISEKEAQIEKGGIPLSQAKQIALDIRKLRGEFREIIADKTALDTHSAEGQADTERFNYLVYACTYRKDTKNRYFSSYKDYMAAGDDAVSVVAASHLANMLYGLEADYESKLPENKFLREYKFVDEKLRFINKEGKLVDIEGRLVNEDGRFIDENGNFIDKYGNKIDLEGNLEVEFSPFTDDEGNPIVMEQEETEAEEIKPEAKKAKKASPKAKKTAELASE